jgi:hypothetical protein
MLRVISFFAVLVVFSATASAQSSAPGSDEATAIVSEAKATAGARLTELAPTSTITRTETPMPTATATATASVTPTPESTATLTPSKTPIIFQSTTPEPTKIVAKETQSAIGLSNERSFVITIVFFCSFVVLTAVSWLVLFLIRRLS